MGATDVTLGAEFSGRLEAGPFRVSIARFPPGFSIPFHVHEWSCVSILIAGRFMQRFSGRSYDCGPGVVLAKPAGERHEDRWFDGWSQHLIIEVDPTRSHQLGPGRAVAEEILYVPNAGAELIAHRVWRELMDEDALTPLAVEGLVLQLIALVQRRRSAEGAIPAWLSMVREFLHDNYRASIRLSDVAGVAGVHPDHLSRVFGKAFGTTIGNYVRRIRVEAAAVKLAESDDSIAAVAQETGFSDQSHLTRVFKRMKGVSPGRYRTAARGPTRRGLATGSEDM